MMIAFKPGWKMTLFTLLFCPVLVQMGLWQLDREQEKIALQQQYNERRAAAPIDISQLDWASEALSYTKIRATGEFENERSFLLDNRINNSRVGYELLTPFKTSGGQTLLVNRGWVPQGRTRADLPQPPAIVGEVTIQASVYVPLGEAFVLSSEANDTEIWPKVIQTIDLEAIEQANAMELLPYTARLVKGSIGALVIDWPAINMEPEKHRGYAVQWFAMLAALILLYTYFGFKHPSTKKEAEEK